LVQWTAGLGLTSHGPTERLVQPGGHNWQINDKSKPEAPRLDAWAITL